MSTSKKTSGKAKSAVARTASKASKKDARPVITLKISLAGLQYKKADDIRARKSLSASGSSMPTKTTSSTTEKAVKKPTSSAKPETKNAKPAASRKPEPKPAKKAEPKSAPKAVKKPAPKAAKKPEAKPEPKKAEPKAAKKPEAKAEPKKPEPKAAKKPEAKAEPKKPEPKAAKKPEAKAEPKKPEPKAAKKPEAKPEPKKAEPKAAKKPEAKPEPKKAEPKTAKEPEAKPEPKKAEPKTAKEPEPKAEKKPEAKAEPKKVETKKAELPPPQDSWDEPDVLPDEDPLTPEEIATYRRKLEDMIGHHIEKAQSLQNQSLTRNDKENPDETGTDDNTRITELTKAGMSEETIRNIEEAIRAIDAGTYGICKSCQRQIPRGRLNAKPEALYCVSCRTEIEEARKMREVANRSSGYGR